MPWQWAAMAFLLLWALGVGGFAARAEGALPTSTATFDSANRLYEQGKFAEAAAVFQQILSSGRSSPALYFNLGNAWFKSGGIGRAIAAYLQASELAPRDPDVRANLTFARKQVQGPTLARSALQQWLGMLSLNEWTWLAFGTLWLWFLLLTLGRWRPALRSRLRASLLGAGIVAGLFCIGFASAYHETRVVRRAIVVGREATVRQTPFDESQAVFNAQDGAELLVLDQKDAWLQVAAAAQKTGWIRQDQVVPAQR